MLRILRPSRGIAGTPIDDAVFRPPTEEQTVTAPQARRRSLRGQVADPWQRLGDKSLTNTLRQICTVCGWVDSQTITGRTLAITSAVEREGKSSIAQALAVTMAQDHNVDVLLIELDVLRASLADDLGTGAGPELVELLAGEATLDEALRPSALPNLWLLPAGQPRPNLSRLLRSPAVPELLEAARGRFSFVILDLPAALRSSDTAVVSRYADGVVMVIRAGVTDQRLVQQAVALLSESKLQGVILNRRRSTLPDLIRRVVEA